MEQESQDQAQEHGQDQSQEDTASTHSDSGQESRQEFRSTPRTLDDEGGDTVSLSDHKSALSEKNKENQSLRKRLRDLESQQKQRDDAEKSQLELMQARVDELSSSNQNLQHRLRKYYFNEQINVPNARWAWAAAQDAGIDIEFDEDHKPTNLTEVRQALRKADPTLFGTAGKADAGEKSKEAPKDQTQAGLLSELLFGGPQ